jgi:type VI secretion system protein ImpH
MSAAGEKQSGRPLMGSTSHPADDPVRFAPHPGMGFPASELKAVEYDEDDDSKPPVIRTTFMGMYGSIPHYRRPISMTSPSAGKGMRRCRAFWIFSVIAS